MQPFKIGEEDLLIEELNLVEKLINLIEENKFFFKNIVNILHTIKDIRNSINRAKEGYTLKDVELFEIKGFVLILGELYEELKTIENQIDDSIMVSRIIELEKLLDPQSTRIRAFYVYDEYSDKLKSIRENIRQIENEIRYKKKSIKEEVEKELSIKLRPDWSVTIQKSQKDILERVSNSSKLTYSSETYMDVKFILKSTPDIYELENELNNLKVLEEKEEQNIRQFLSKSIGSCFDSINENILKIGKLDLILAKAYMAIDTNSTKPAIIKEQRVNIKNGRHLKVEDILKSNSQEFTPISIDLTQGVSCITGANMGGKTVSLKLVGLLSAMAQYGLFVPCTSMETGLHGFIYASIEDTDSIDKGLSTFGSEICGIKKAIKRADEGGLILIDELARGTNPDEGYAISKAVVHFLRNKKSITLITTHYDNVANTDKVKHYQVVGLSNIDYEELKEKLIKSKNSMDIVREYMDYRLKKVTEDTKIPRDAINIARLMGLEESIVADAEKILLGHVKRTE